VTEDFTASRDALNETKGFSPPSSFGAVSAPATAMAGKGDGAANSAIPRKKPPAARAAVRHRVSGTNRRARSA
jgi:hypothetical protein